MASRRVSRALFVPSPRPGAAAAGPSAAAAASVPAAHAYSLRTRSAPSTAPRSDEDEPEDIKPKGKGRQKDGADDAAYSDSAVKRAAPSASPAKRRSSASASPNKKIAGIKRAADSPEPLSPRKTKLPPKLELSQEETLPPPPHWEETLRVLSAQRTRIVAPVDTMGCEENGREERRADAGRERESDEEEKKRERLAVLIGLMLSSQTKDPVTAAAVRALQTGLPGGLHLDALLTVSPELLNGLISKVGFHNRKTHYIRSVAALLASDFDGDVPRTLADLCSLPGVGPKMAFLALQGAWGENVGIGVDTHVHRLTNRLGWGPTKDAEGTRLRLQSFLPKSLHRSINKTLVGFGQIICVPIGPRCDLCDLAPTGLCPSVRTLDPKRAAARVKVELLPLAKEEVKQEEQLEAEAEQQIRAGGVKKEKLAW